MLAFILILLKGSLKTTTNISKFSENYIKIILIKNKNKNINFKFIYK